MDRRTFLATSLAGLLAAGPALAASFQDEVVAQLKKQGFGSIRVQRTLLGRVRILASRGDGQREIILNPRTGEILRDLWVASGAGGSGDGLLLEDDGSRGDDDARDDDDGEEEEDDDEKDDGGGSNSGSGSDNSGSGSDNSGSGGGDDDDGEDD